MKKLTLIAAVLGLASGASWAQSDPATMPPNSWLSVPNTKLRSVAPIEGQFPGTWGVIGPSGVVSAWSGAALDTRRSRLIVFGGGHADYGGNELYAFNVASLTWERLTDPTVSPAADDSDQNPDGTPQSRHSYGGLAYLAHADRFFALGGSVFSSGHAACTKPWTFDLAAKTWTRDANAAPFTPGYDCSSAYDPVTHKLWFCEFTSGTWAVVHGYDFDTKAWSTLPIGTDRGYSCVALDSRRGLLVTISLVGVVTAYDVRGNAPGQVWTTSGDQAFQNGDAWEGGFDYDPVSDKLVGWRRDKVYVLDPGTKVWTSYAPAGAPATTAAGIFGRWRYVPSVDAFILLTSTDDDVHFYKMPSTGAAAPAILTQPTDQTVTVGQTATFSVSASGTAPLSYQWQRNGVDIAGATSASYTTLATALADSGATFRVIVSNAAGSATSSSATLTVSPVTSSLPAPWLDLDLGTPGIAGSASYSGGTFMVGASGLGAAGTSDQLNFVYRPLSGDGEITARVAGLGTGAGALAGVMIRETLDANASFACSALAAGIGTEFLDRAASGSGVATTAGWAATAPYWMRLVRSGNTLSGYASPDGTAWTLVGSAVIAMRRDAWMGFVVWSGSNTAGTTAMIDSVAGRYDGTAPPAPGGGGGGHSRSHSHCGMGSVAGGLPSLIVALLISLALAVRLRR